MAWGTIFLVLNALIIPAWSLLFLAPKASVTRKLVHSGAMPLVLRSPYTFF